jgi:hypothetical protein
MLVVLVLASVPRIKSETQYLEQPIEDSDSSTRKTFDETIKNISFFK